MFWKDLSDEEKIDRLRYGFSVIRDRNSMLRSDIRDLKDRNESLQNELYSMRRVNQENENKINSLQNNNYYLQQNIDNLVQKQREEERIKIIEQNKLTNFKKAFENDKNIIKNKNITNLKNYITNFIINEFVKEFETNSEKKSNFTTTLINYMNKLTQEFMKYNEFFIQSFKVNSQNIIKNYNVKDNNISIEHINFIVIGKAGTGKVLL